MAPRKIELPRDSISLSASLTDALLRKGSGDAALMLLYLLRHDGNFDPEEACRTMKWSREQVESAMVLLGELGINTGTSRDIFAEPVPKKENAPEYSTHDIVNAQEDPEFSGLLREIEHVLGRQLGKVDLSRLLDVYDHVGLPSEVIMMLVNMVCEDYQEKHGPGRHPRSLAAVSSIAYRWKEQGIDSLEAVESFLNRRQYFRSQEGALLNALGIVGRKATPTERDYLMKWAQWGFGPEALAVAYDKTMVGTGKMSWSYCNKILERWHSENRHTLEEVQAATPAPRKGGRQSRNALQIAQPMTPQQEAEQARRMEESQKWMLEFLNPDQSKPE